MRYLSHTCEWCQAAEATDLVQFDFFTMSVCPSDVTYAIEQGGKLLDPIEY